MSLLFRRKFEYLGFIPRPRAESQESHMSTILASSLTACVAIVVALLVYFITRSSYSAGAAASEATAIQLAVQLDERGAEMTTLRGKLATELNLRGRAEATLEEERKSIAQQKNMLKEAEQKLTGVFEGLASKVLANNTTTFLELADSTLKSGAVKDLKDLVEPTLRVIIQPVVRLYGRIGPNPLISWRKHPHSVRSPGLTHCSLHDLVLQHVYPLVNMADHEGSKACEAREAQTRNPKPKSVRPVAGGRPESKRSKF